jgi:hypothetical protein
MSENRCHAQLTVAMLVNNQAQSRRLLASTGQYNKKRAEAEVYICIIEHYIPKSVQALAFELKTLKYLPDRRNIPHVASHII